jgi:TIR domain
MHEIFISYRHDDSSAWALMLRDALVKSFGADRVYLDRDTQRAGNWREQINTGIALCKVVLVPIGPRWLSTVGKDGGRRLDMPDDVHRLEIALALSTQGVTVIPIRVESAPMPSPEDLSEDIRALADQQWRQISPESAHRVLDINRLIEDVERATGLVARKPLLTKRPLLGRIRLIALALIITLFVLTTANAVPGWQDLGSGETVVVFLIILVLLAGGRSLLRLIRRSK